MLILLDTISHEGLQKHPLLDKKATIFKYYGFFSRYLVGLDLVTETPSGQGREQSRLAAEDAVKLSESSQQLMSTLKS